MFLFKWVERGKLDQILAPDENYVADPETEEQSFFENVAPDPNFASPERPPPEGCIQCEHCRKYTRLPASVNLSTPVAATPSSTAAVASTPHTQASSMQSPEDAVQGLVLDRTLSLASAFASPKAARSLEDTIFSFCANNAVTTNHPKAEAKRQKSRARNAARLRANPRLFSATSCRCGSNPPDGYTPLMTCAYSNNVQAAQLLMELGPVEQLEWRNLQGKTALHIASECGNVEMVQYLQSLMPSGGLQEIDLLGHTAYGSAMTSPLPRAQRHKSALKQLLYKPNDLSVMKTPAPALQRTQLDRTLQFVSGYAEQPGQRITMEDAILAKLIAEEQAAVLAVCDGHGDGGHVSKFVAQAFSAAVTDMLATTAKASDWSQQWHAANLHIDAQLKATGMAGGSTAVCAVVLVDEIIVANVGDSRCILIQQNNESATTMTASLEGEMDKLSLQDAAMKITKQPDFTVLALSEDHKPDIASEKARIEAAGLTMVEESFKDENGQLVTIPKVAVASDNRLATSRAFGDFEYKANKELPADQQAVVAVPDVVVHRRDLQKDAYLVLACDGIWDCMSNEEVGEFVLQQQEVSSLPVVADALVAECFRRGSTDNMSAIVVALSQKAEQYMPSVPDRKQLFSPKSG